VSVKVGVAADGGGKAVSKVETHAFAHRLYMAAEAGKLLSAGAAGFFLIP